jgi:desulfoferrodoxin (superoxide reductase-like protein)
MKQKILLVLVSVVLFCVTSVYAHPPADINIKFDSASKIITAVITHNTANPANHYIAKVDVGLNGKEIISQEISLQDNADNQTVSYLIPDAKKGDVLSVEAYCSISGKLKEEITIDN